jgi:hypothetical protein
VQSLLDHNQSDRHHRAVPRADAPRFVRAGVDGRELATARWGMPLSAHALMEATKKRAAKLEPRAMPSTSRNCSE